MRKLRNPRYAPESLERKLSPSAMVAGVMPTAAYAPATASMNTAASEPPPEDLPPFPPYGPTVPA